MSAQHEAAEPAPTAKRIASTALTATGLLSLLAVLTVELTPHARGIGLPLALRPSTLVPACAAAAVAASISGGLALPRWTVRRFRAALAAAGLLLLALAWRFGSARLASFAVPTVLIGALLLAMWIPRAMRRPPSRIAWVALAALALLLLGGAARARSTEGTLPMTEADVPRRLFDVEHHFLTLPTGERVHYIDEGSGPTLLLLHGNPAWSYQWHGLIDGLCASPPDGSANGRDGSFRCVAPDYPGFGLSTAPAGYGYTPAEQSRVVEAFVDHLGLHELTLVMQDWGGPIGLAFAARRPERVRRVVLGNTWAWQTPRTEPRGMFSTLMGGPVGEVAQLGFGAFAPAGVAGGVVEPLAPEVLDLYVRPFRSLDTRGIAAFYPGQITDASVFFSELEAGLPALAETPALIFWGFRDPGFPRADLERMERLFSEHRTIELPDANHFFFEDEEARVVAEITSFASAAP